MEYKMIRKVTRNKITGQYIITVPMEIADELHFKKINKIVIGNIGKKIMIEKFIIEEE